MSTEIITREDLKKVIIDAMKEVQSVQHQEWWSLQDATKRKGLNYKTACNRRELQPNGGIPEGKIGGRNVWHWRTIEKWLKQTDEMILEGGDDE